MRRITRSQSAWRARLPPRRDRGRALAAHRSKADETRREEGAWRRRSVGGALACHCCAQARNLQERHTRCVRPRGARPSIQGNGHEEAQKSGRCGWADRAPIGAVRSGEPAATFCAFLWPTSDSKSLRDLRVLGVSMPWFGRWVEVARWRATVARERATYRRGTRDECGLAELGPPSKAMATKGRENLAAAVGRAARQ